jgi:cytochrome c-type biogenesis protein CcmH
VDFSDTLLAKRPGSWQAPAVTRKPLLVALFSVAVGLSVASAAQADDPHAAHGASQAPTEDLKSFVPGAAALEGKILAPCCWNQTIDIHGSPVANELRREIRSRLRAGETPDAIQASIVDRYGPKILAMPADSPLAGIAVGLLVAIGGVGAAAFAMLKRWRKAGTPTKRDKKKTDEPSDTGLDARLDAELRALDD